jgi:hypothetical protein
MALDEQRDNDEVYEEGGFQYLVDKDFLEKAQPIKVDYIVNGFKLDCNIDFGGGGCAGCGTDDHNNNNSNSCGC